MQQAHAQPAGHGVVLRHDRAGAEDDGGIGDDLLQRAQLGDAHQIVDIADEGMALQIAHLANGPGFFQIGAGGKQAEAIIHQLAHMEAPAWRPGQHHANIRLAMRQADRPAFRHQL